MSRIVKLHIRSNLGRQEFQEAAKKEPVKAAAALDPELRDFEQWLLRRDIALTKVERQMVVEYLGFRMTNPVDLGGGG